MPKASLEKTLKEMDIILTKAFNKDPLPGLAVGVIYEGELVYSKAFGFADVERKKPVTMDTVFRIMSISKTFTGIGLMQLWEQGKFDLDDPVNPHLMFMKVQHDDPEAPPVTFRHLLTHTSGIGETRGLTDFTRPVVGLGARPDTRILPMPEYYNGRLKPEIYPGEKWAYSNHAYAVLAQLIEDISGVPFPEYMRKNVFEPLGMTRTDYVLSARVRSELAQGYQFKVDRFVPVDYLRLNTPGCGGIFSSVNEMAKYVAALMDGGKNQHGSVIKPGTLKMMMTSQLETDARVHDMGLAFILDKYGRYAIAEHGGGWPGFISDMKVAPGANTGVVVFTNSSSRAPGIIARDIMHRLLGVANPDEKVPDLTILQTPTMWPKLVGSYGPSPGLLTNARVWMNYGGELEVYVKKRQLRVRSLSGPVSKGVPIYRADSKDPLFYKAKFINRVVPAVFHTNEHGEVDRLEIMDYSLYKRPIQQGIRFKLITAVGAAAGTLLFGFMGAFLRKKRAK
ncbi:MAG: beta-lactamase family protein [Anaerolineaceae bacterium]|nr:beta-lactamase family protein [Anaerolineaceae bacterium]